MTEPFRTTVDLTTTYLGLPLKNPLVASASPLSKKIDSVRRLADAGIAAVVLYSLFEEQITHESRELDHYLTRGTNTYAEALSYFPDLEDYNIGPEPYLEHLHRVKQVVDIPVIGSLNGVSTGGSLKLSPFFTALPNIARRFAHAGADGLVLFNRFYQPDFDLEQLEVVPNLTLSTSDDLRLPLRWIAMLYGRMPVDFALSGGVHTAEDVLKAMMAGASVAMMTSELLAHGIARVRDILVDLQTWMIEHEYQSIAQMRGSMSQRAVAEPAAFERANYMKALNSFDNRLP